MGLKAEARAADSWSDPFSLITVIMVEGMMPSEDDHRASLSLNTGENRIPPPGSVAPSRVLEAD